MKKKVSEGKERSSRAILGYTKIHYLLVTCAWANAAEYVENGIIQVLKKL